jgi:hypothetical protein
MQNASQSSQASNLRMDRPWRNDALWLDVLLALVLWAIGQFAASRDVFQFGTGLNVVKSTLYSNEAVIFAATFGFLIAGTAIIASSTNLNRIKVGYYPTARECRVLSCCDAEHLHGVKVLILTDEFRDGSLFAVIQEKFRQRVSQRAGNDELGRSNSGSDGSQPGAERVPDLGRSDGC